ncbi:MAG: DHA2 family efflux MFS transporter permease subunit [Rhodothermia bacterium]|nr:DHA2 family efflux MFS transporter permease subunit [Rhodothermia bacterium]
MLASTDVAPSEKGLAYKWKVLWSVIFGLFLVILDQTVVNVAFPTLRNEFNAPLDDTQWVLSIYVMAMGISTPLAGFLGDRFGMKRIYILGISLFVVSSLLCGLSDSLPLLILARALQGIGGGLALPLGSAQLFRAFPPHEQGLALGLFGIALTMAPALGPIVGGWLVTHDMWRWIFYLNVPIGVLGVLIASRWLKETIQENAPKLNMPSLVASTIGFGAILYAASIAADKGWTSTPVLSWLVVGILGLVALSYIELKLAKEPLLDLRLFKNPVFLKATIIGYVATVALFGAEFLMPIYLQALRGYSALDTGIYLLPLALTAGLVTAASGRIYDYIGPRPLIVVGYAVIMLNTWHLSHIQADTSIEHIMWLLAERGIGIGLTVQATFTAALGVAPLDKVSRASSLINATRNAIQAIAVAILATILVSAVSPKIKNLQDQLMHGAPTEHKDETFKGGVCSEMPAAGSFDDPFASPFASGLGKKMRDIRKQACTENLKGLSDAYLLTFYFSILAFVLGLFLPGWPGKWSGREGLRQPMPAAH